MAEKKISRRLALAGVVGTAVGAAMMAVLGKMARPAYAYQPHMDNALGLLNNALAQLQSAEADKGGYRARAIDHTERAIHEVHEGIRFANHH